MQFDQLSRRKVITLLGSTVAWPLAVRAEQVDRTRRVGILSGLSDRNSKGLVGRMAATFRSHTGGAAATPIEHEPSAKIF